MAEQNPKFFKTEKDMRVIAEVFSPSTLDIIFSLAGKKWFNRVEHVISTGKEAHFFLATDSAGNPRGVKIYKIETSDFKNMHKYIDGDVRFKHVPHQKKDLVYEWTRKEFKNLTKATEAKVSCPIPLTFKGNVLVMSFIGEGEEASPIIKRVRIPEEEKQSIYDQIIENLAKLFYKAGLIHADLSEYNIMYKDGKVVFIDFGQAVLKNHPRAKEFFDRDIFNLQMYFQKIGIEKTREEILEDIRAKK
ncbi:MAG: serine protein kinase RIO [Candidatus Diapherotrites archaeon]|nr:serine protein kinase RIO [Candidatus Diapherotrites archaeon]